MKSDKKVGMSLLVCEGGKRQEEKGRVCLDCVVGLENSLRREANEKREGVDRDWGGVTMRWFKFLLGVRSDICK